VIWLLASEFQHPIIKAVHFVRKKQFVRDFSPDKFYYLQGVGDLNAY